ncbi:MAG: hypothetical protein A2W99_04190 [Bacteroidetes bacterium GWF2_33_16]|nr:MAG: hypothetical protein A2X00_16710 [Bacteroidetes bacterium GWE2_32_14]OFY05872.1 MAG: hypothetical protein A2W99_04190 [Bacteroidetes bacterium GWF2_33_16]
MDLFGISEIAVIPVRIEPSEKCEMVTQVLFGEIFKIINEKNNWSQVELLNDGYIGWIDSKTITLLTDDFSKEMQKQPSETTKNLFTEIIKSETNESLIIPFGSSLPCFNNKTGNFNINTTNYKLNNYTKNEDLAAHEYAKYWINAPYLWGGKNPFGVDCSGFVQLVYKVVGIMLPRDSAKQAALGTTIEFLDEILPGDLVYFDNEEGNIIHTGILLSKNKIIHASGKVRIDSIDHQGLYNKELKKYTHKLRIIKRVKS